VSTDLATWLLEQIAEDERVAGGLPADGYPKHGSRVLSVEGTLKVPWPDRWNPVHVLAECDAKRLILREHRRYDEWIREEMPSFASPSADAHCVGCGFGSTEEPRTEHIDQCPTLRALALPYTDRPGYREEWRP
jgi:hypothetical protein